MTRTENSSRRGRFLSFLLILLIVCCAAVSASAVTATSRKFPLAYRQSFDLNDLLSDFEEDETVTKWTTSDKKIATVRNGVVKAKAKAGKVRITLKTNLNHKLTFTLTVQKAAVAPTSLKLNKKSVKLDPGEKFRITSKVAPVSVKKKVTFKSSNTGVAKVSSRGTVTAVKPGTAKITAACGTKKAVLSVTVRTVTVFTVDETEVTLTPGRSKTVNVTLIPKGTIACSISDTDVVSCSFGTPSDGNYPLKIKALKTGTADLILKAAGKTLTVHVTVK